MVRCSVSTKTWYHARSCCAEGIWFSTTNGMATDRRVCVVILPLGLAMIPWDLPGCLCHQPGLQSTFLFWATLEMHLFMSPGLEAIAVFSDSQVVCFPLNCGRCRMQLFTWLPLHEWHVLSSPHYWAHKNFTDVMGSWIFETFLSHSLEYMSPDKACSVLPTSCSSGPISKMLLI